MQADAGQCGPVPPGAAPAAGDTDPSGGQHRPGGAWKDAAIHAEGVPGRFSSRPGTPSARSARRGRALLPLLAADLLGHFGVRVAHLGDRTALGHSGTFGAGDGLNDGFRGGVGVGNGVGDGVRVGGL